MKKVIFALAAVVALAACSKEQTVSFDKGAAIGFDTFVDNATRVDDPSLNNTNLTNFGVFGTVSKTGTALIFDNVEVTGTGVGNNWSYASQYTQYWIAGAKYNFAAVAPQTVEVGGVDVPVYNNASYAVTSSEVGGETVYTGTTILSFVNNGEIDLLYAEAKAVGVTGSGTATPANGKVAFTFRHVLSKIKFSFENQYISTGSTIAVREIKLKNAHETATATLNENTKWASHDGSVLINFGNTENTTGVAATSIAQGKEWESENVRFIIPGKEHKYTVSFFVDVLYGTTLVETYEHTASLTFTPTAGIAYDIKTVIDHTNIDPAHAQEPILFTVTEVDGWDTPVEKDATID